MSLELILIHEFSNDSQAESILLSYVCLEIDVVKAMNHSKFKLQYFFASRTNVSLLKQASDMMDKFHKLMQKAKDNFEVFFNSNLNFSLEFKLFESFFKFGIKNRNSQEFFTTLNMLFSS